MSPRAVLVRIAWTVLSLLVALCALHAVTYLLPGDPVRALFGFQSPGPELLAELRAVYQLDDPYLVQLGRWLSGLVTGDLGPLYGLAPGGLADTGQSVSEVIWATMPSSLRLVGTAAVLQLVIGSTLAIALADASGRRLQAAKALVSLLIAVPSFAMAGLLQIWAPGLVDAANLLAGAACLAALPAGMVALVGFPTVREVRRSGYIRSALARGVPGGRVRWLHMLRPSVLPMLALSAAETGTLLASTVLVEPVLQRPGVGRLLIQAVDVRQGPLLLAIVGVFLIAVAVATLLADLLSLAADPRIVDPAAS